MFVPPPCPFCIDNVRGQEVVRKQTLFQSRSWTVLFDHKPMTKGHLVIIPTAHRERRSEITPEENADLYEVFQRINTIYNRVFGYSNNITYEKNGLGIPHFQIHVIPVSSKLHSLWLQVMLFIRTLPIPFWTLNETHLTELRNEFLRE
jgi:diadenosine tetraphosphate (Ap4A) HIT family hydrolase